MLFEYSFFKMNWNPENIIMRKSFMFMNISRHDCLNNSWHKYMKQESTKSKEEKRGGGGDKDEDEKQNKKKEKEGTRKKESRKKEKK
jgi:hypothetical protein